MILSLNIWLERTKTISASFKFTWAMFKSVCWASNSSRSLVGVDALKPVEVDASLVGLQARFDRGERSLGQLRIKGKHHGDGLAVGDFAEAVHPQLAQQARRGR